MRSRLLFLGAALTVLLGASGHSEAAVFQVTRFDDPLQPFVCDADCSLREAVWAANASPGFDHIVLQPGIYHLSIQGNWSEEIAQGGDLDITDDVLVSGPDQATTTIDALGLSATEDARVFDVRRGSMILTQVTLQNGRPTMGSGGGVRVERGASLTLAYTTFVANRATETNGTGGGVFNRGTLWAGSSTFKNNFAASGGGGLANEGRMTLADVVVEDNVAANYGGGVMTNTRIAAEEAAALEMRESRIRNNRAGTSDLTGAGGGIYHGCPSASLVGTLTVVDTEMNGNRAAQGGGIAVGKRADTRLTNARVVYNRSETGGGVWNAGLLIAERTQVRFNTAGRSGGGLWNRGHLTLTETRVGTNTAGWEGGGGLWNAGQSIATQGVFFNNVARDGGAIFNWGVLQLTNSTLALNRATRGSALFNSDHLPTAYEPQHSLQVRSVTVQAQGEGTGVAFFGEPGAAADVKNTIVQHWQGPAPGPALTCPAYVLPGDTLTVTAHLGSSALDWAGVFEAGAPYSAPPGWQYVLLPRPATVTFTAPSAIGPYEVRLFANDGAAQIGASCPFQVATTRGPTPTPTPLPSPTPTPGPRPALCAGGPWTSLGYNIDTDGSCSLVAPGDRPFTNPLTLAYNPLQGTDGSAELTAGSPAIDAGDPADCPAVDLRGLARPHDGDGDGSPICDIGAYERYLNVRRR